MCVLLFIVAALAAAGPSIAFPVRLPAEATADSLYDAQAIDSLHAFSTRMIARAVAGGDSVLFGRMTYHRGRARLALRDPQAPLDFERAFSIATAIGDSTGCMHALGLQAFVAVNQGNFARSIELNEERIALARALKRRGSEAWGHLLIGYAEVYRENYARAQDEYEEAWRAFGDAGRVREQLTASIGLARALGGMGRHDEERRSYQRAWLTARELGDRGQEADAINNLGVIEELHGELGPAGAYFERAYRIKRDLKSFDIANAARNVSRVDMVIGRYAHAESTLVEAAGFGNRGMLDVGLSVELARLRLERGRFAGCARCAREILARRSTVPARTRTQAVTLLAGALAALDSLPAAVAIMGQELEALPRDSPSITRAEALLEWSRCLRASGEAGRAREMAHRAWGDSSARRDSTLMVLAAAEMSLSERSLGNRADAFAWFERARGVHRASRVSGEFQWREARRAALARALIHSGDVLRVHPSTATEEARARALFDFLQELHARTLLERVTDPRRFDDIDPALARPSTSEALQLRVLKPGECLFTVNPGAGCLYVFALTSSRFAATVIDDAGNAVTDRFRNYIRLASSAPWDNAASTAASRALGELLFEDVAALLRESPRIFAAFDGVLAGSPFETLTCPGESGPLMESHEVVRVPSAAFLKYQRARPAGVPQAASLLAAAAGSPALPGARTEVNHLASRYAGAKRAIDPDRTDFLDALARFDVIHVASHVHVDSERPWHSGIQIGRPAAAPPAADREPRATGPLVLSPSDAGQIARTLPADPFVRASEIANRRLNASLVVLSACESALGRAAHAEGVLGIASSFVSAGSRAVVASLWAVDDRTTADLMKRFYRELSSGKTAAAALRVAQLGIRESRPEPFFWAGFVVIGDGDVVVRLEPRPSAGRWAIIALAGLSVVAAAVWVICRPRSREGRIAA